jgi:peptidoglycan/LPS O-acetylase OafA/YrhL
MKTMNNQLYFKGLNEIRALAAFSVIFHHLELYKFRIGMKSLFDFSHINHFISSLGKNGVFLFFVLSGFLITYLLLQEKKEAGKISILKFYGRRIIRIWPLYFIILLVGFWFLPYVYNLIPDFFEGQIFYNERIVNLEYGYNLLLFMLFFSNVALGFYGGVAGASQSWSVSVEEQFYFIWPWIVKFFYKKLILILIAIVVLINLIKFNLSLLDNFLFLKYFFQTFHIDFMAIGGIVALLYKDYELKAFKFLENKFLLSIVLLLIVPHLFFEISNLTLGVLFSFLIVLMIERNKEITILSNIGKWSYGIYMYHPLIMYFTFSLVYQLEIKSQIVNNFLIYFCVVFGSVLLSYFSFKYIETYFLKFKKHFNNH